MASWLHDGLHDALEVCAYEAAKAAGMTVPAQLYTTTTTVDGADAEAPVKRTTARKSTKKIAVRDH